MNTLETLQHILASEYKLDRDRLTPDAELVQLGVDSLDFLELMFKVEDQFGLKIKDDIPTNLVTLNDVAVYIDTLRAQRVSTVGGGLSTPVA